MGRLFGPKRFEVPRDCRELDNEVFRDLHYVNKYYYADEMKA